LTKNNFEKLSDLNAEFFESAKLSLLDPLGLYLANDVKWIKVNENWNSLKFPVVIGGKGQPILLLHGFDSSFLEFRRIYKSLKRNFKLSFLIFWVLVLVPGAQQMNTIPRK